MDENQQFDLALAMIKPEITYINMKQYAYNEIYMYMYL